MTEITIKKGLRRTKVLVYDNIDQLTAERFRDLNRYWMLDANIGSSFDDIDAKHITKLVELVKHLPEDKDRILRALENMRLLIYAIIQGVNVEQLSFACLVHSINGEEITDFSEDGLHKTLDRLGRLGLTEGLIKKKYTKSKNAFMQSLRNFFQTTLTIRELKRISLN